MVDAEKQDTGETHHKEGKHKKKHIRRDTQPFQTKTGNNNTRHTKKPQTIKQQLIYFKYNK